MSTEVMDMSDQPKEVRLVGYIRKQAWNDVLQRPQTRLYTGATVYNLPYLYTEPQQDGYEWLEVAVTLQVTETLKGEG